MALESAKEIIERFDLIKSDRKTFENTWQIIADEMLGTDDFNIIRAPGETRMRRIYDTTGLTAGHMLAGTIHGLMVNPAAKWFSMWAEPEEIMEDEEVKDWLDHTTRTLDFVFKQPRFGFLNAAAEDILGLVFFGTCCNYIEDMPGFGPRFYSRPLGEIHVDEAWTGRIDTIYRDYKVRGRKYWQEFGKGTDDKVDRAIDKNANEEIRIIHLTHPRSDLEKGGERSDPRPWRSIHVLYDQKKQIKKSGYWTNPWQIGRWSKDARELYGRSPAWVALSDQRMLNEMSFSLIKAAQKAVDPPILIPDEGVLTQLDTSPGSLIVYRSGMFRAGEDPIRPFPISTDIVITREIIGQRQNMVKDAFFMPLIEAPTGSGVPATQTLDFDQRMSRTMVSMLGRVESELFHPILQRTLDVLDRGGLLLEKPPQLEEAEIIIRFVGPVSRSQRQVEAQAIVGAWAAGGQIAPTHPDVFDNLDPDKSMRIIARASGVPPSVVRSADEVDEIREIRAQAEQQRQLLEQFTQASSAAGSLAPAITAAADAQGGGQAAPQ